MPFWPGYLLPAYFIVSVVAAVIYVRSRWSGSDDLQAAQPPADRRKRPSRLTRLVWVGLVAAAIPLGLGLLLPIFQIYGCVRVRRESAFRGRFSRTFRDHVFARRHVMNMPRRTREFIAATTPELVALRFSVEGDYLLKPNPVPLYGRCFSGPDGETVAVLSSILESLAVSFTTILDDGRVIETASVELTPGLRKINETGQYTCVSVRGDSLPAAYRQHQEAVSRAEQHRRCRRLSFTPDQVTDVLQYENRVFGKVRYALGELDDPPPAPECPPGSIRLNTRSVALAAHA